LKIDVTPVGYLIKIHYLWRPNHQYA